MDTESSSRAIKCRKCGAKHDDDKVSSRNSRKEPKDEMEEVGSLKKECRDQFKFHGLLTTYTTLARDVAQTKGTKILNRHYTQRKEFLDDVVSLCTVGVIKKKLVGVITHMDNIDVEFFTTNSKSTSEEIEVQLLASFKVCIDNWLHSHMDEKKIAFITYHDALLPMMQRDEAVDVEAAAIEYQSEIDEMKKSLMAHNVDWQIFCAGLSPPLETVASTDISNAKEALTGLAQTILGPKAKVKKVG